YGNQYKITWKGTPWNNTTVSTAPTFRYELDYDANLELINGDMFLPDSRSTTTNRVIENGGLSFKDVPQELRFNATKLSTDLNEQLIAREDKDWEIGITDFRGTKAKSVTDSDVARQDWDLVATVAPFKDSSNQEIGLETLGITYVDETNTKHELSETETLINQHEVSGETPKEHHEQQIKWAEGKGLQAVVHDRNQLKTDETYQADVTFELRSAP
ncbi:hypothetical protein, partial [Enterococcus sp. ZJ1622]|uniref:hypothetical protein n=1 Tax=Enterococcus sp. ZJ1622 TaxID=2709401 RepID=UPI0013EE0E9B